MFLLTNFQKGTPINIIYFDKNTGTSISKSGIISSILDDELIVMESIHPFNRISILINELISIEKYEMNQELHKAMKDFSRISEELENRKKEISKYELAKEKQMDILNQTVFLESYSVDGAINFLNGIANLYPEFSINENKLKFSFFKNDDGQIEASIKSTRRFEFYNTTQKSDIDKAADTYAPDIREELKENLTVFDNIFLVNRFSRKVSDYLYESVSEYHGEFNCTKENFFEKKKELDTFVEKYTNSKED